jgi:RND family efflux transporter MFP subunit
MIRKNILGIIIIILIIGSFWAGHQLGSSKQPLSQSTKKIDKNIRKKNKKVEQPKKIPGSNETRAKSALTDEPVDNTTVHSFYGFAFPYDAANVQGNQGGTIVELNGKEGDIIQKGEILVGINSREIQIQLQKSISAKKLVQQQNFEAEANYKANLTIVNRNKTLHEKGLISGEQWNEISNKLNSAYFALESAKANLEQSTFQIALNEENLKKYQILSPISGIIESKKYNIDEVYKTGDIVFHIINIDNIYVETMVSESYISHLSKSMHARVFFDAVTSQEFEGKIVSLLPSGSVESNNFIVKVLIHNINHTIKPGMFARVDVNLGLSGDL